MLPMVPKPGRAKGPDCAPFTVSGATGKEMAAVGDGVEPPDRAGEAFIRRGEEHIRTAVAGGAGAAEVAVDVLVLAALPVGGGEGQAALPGGGSGKLPAPDDVVDPTAG